MQGLTENQTCDVGSLLKDLIYSFIMIQLQFYTITMSNGRIQYGSKAARMLISKHICMKAIISYYKKKLAFLKETEEALGCVSIDS